MGLVERIAALDLAVLSHIESQTTEDDRKSLLALHATVAETLGTFSYLEIGSYLGGSLQSFVVDPRCVEIMSIDPRPAAQPDDRGEVFTYPRNSTERMLGLLSQIPGADLSKLRNIEKATTDLEPGLLPRADLCLIDGEHTRRAALHDAEFCREVTRGEGIIVFHDRSVVAPAIRAFLGGITAPYRAYSLRDAFFVVELGQMSVLKHTRVRSRLEFPRAAWLTMNRFGIAGRLLDERTQRLLSAGRRIVWRASAAQSRVAAALATSTNGSLPDDACSLAAMHPGSARSAARVAPIVQDFVHAKSVVDVGCGTGAWLTEFAKLGADEFVGVDGEYAQELWSLDGPGHSFVATDLTRPLLLNRRFDLAICLEVGQRVPRERSAGLVKDLTRLAPVVLFSAAVPSQGGVSHVAESWPDQWAELFLDHGYTRLDVLRHLLWEEGDVEPWYAQNTFLYASEAELSLLPDLRDAPVSGYPLRAVHPRLFTSRVEMLEHMLKRSQEDPFLLRALRRAASLPWRTIAPQRGAGCPPP